MGRGLSGIINMLREKEREAGRGIKRGVTGKVSGGVASGFKGMASGISGSAKKITESAGRRGSSYGRGGVRKIGEKYYFKANPYSGKGIKKWEPPKFAESGLMKLSQEGRENLLRANREEYLSRINPYSTPSEYIKTAEAKEKADKLKEEMRLKR